MTGLVDRAEKRGVVARVRDQRDRRAARIELTEQGREIAYAAHRKVTEHVEGSSATSTPATVSAWSAW